MPLHTEYRFFIDLNKNEIIGYSPYWEPNLMKQRLGKGNDSETSLMTHDYVIYCMHESRLTERFNKNINKLYAEVNKILPNINLSGQWSLDIMQNGDDFWIIDMALAQNSALLECVPKDKLEPSQEDWLQIEKIQSVWD